MIVSWRFSGVVVVGDVEGVEVCGELERGGHQADKAGQEQQVDELNITTTTTATRKTTAIILQTWQSSRSRSRSMLSKSNAESLNKFGLIGVAEPDQKSAKSRKVQIHKSDHLYLTLIRHLSQMMIWFNNILLDPNIEPGTICSDIPLSASKFASYFGNFKSIYPSQHQNLLPTLKIITHNFQNYQKIQNFGKKIPKSRIFFRRRFWAIIENMISPDHGLY